MNNTTQISQKAVLKIGFSEESINAVINVFPLLMELENQKIKFHFLLLKDEQDHISLRLEEKDKALVEELFKDLYDLDIKDSWEDYDFDQERFGNERSHQFIDTFLSEANRLVLKSLSNKVHNFDYGDLLSDAVLFFHFFTKAIFADARTKEEFYEMYFEQWKFYLPKGVGKKEILQSWKEEIGILKTVVQPHSPKQKPNKTFDLYKQFGELGISLKKDLEDQIEKDNFQKRTSKYNYPIKIKSDIHQSKYEIIADMMHFFFNAFGIQNEDEALVCLLSHSIELDN